MHYTDEQAVQALDHVRQAIAQEAPDPYRIRLVWNQLQQNRARILAGTMRQMLGEQVYSGPFKGMQLTEDVMTGTYAPHLLGCYEHELHPIVQRVIASPIKRILNIGCSFGYYSVGFARHMPQVTCLSFDIDTDARRKCADLAALNHVQDRVIVSGEFRGEDFARYADPATLVFMDIEGAEKILLDPTLYTALRTMPVIVEMHDLLDADISRLIIERFQATHVIDVIYNQSFLLNVQFGTDPHAYIDPFDRLLLTWEQRDGPTPWAVMWPK